MTTPDATPALLPAEAERRLHPGSWLFVLLQNLRQFIVPLAVLLFAGAGATMGIRGGCRCSASARWWRCQSGST